MVLMALGVFISDRLLKAWALTVLKGSGALPGLPGIFRFLYAENTGAAFGLLETIPWAGYLLTPLILLAGGLYLRKWRLGLWPRLCAGAILGGALGNYLDRLLYGFVIDMIDLTFMRFAVFNLADAAICTGCVLMAVSLLVRTKDWRPKHA